jgi:hypothetical protein
MLRRLTILFLLAAVIEQSGFAQGAQPKAAPPPAKPEDDAPPAMAVPPTYKFESRGRRDPFVNPVPKPVGPAVVVPAVRPPGLKGVLLAEATLTAIVVSREAPELSRVAISTPGNKTYFAHKGDAIFDAVIKDIQRDAVVFELSSRDQEGKTTTREVVRKIRSTP